MNPLAPDGRRQGRLDEQALDWFVRHGGGLDRADEAAFQAWLAADPAHRAAYARWQDDWDALDALSTTGVEALRRNLAATRHGDAADHGGRRTAESGQSCAPPPPRDRGAPTHRRRWLDGARAAAPRTALAAVILAASAGGLLAWQHGSQPVFAAQYASARGEQRAITLPDGSALRLDTQTRVEVAIYRHRREVRLPEGQAVFDVAPDGGKPFDVLVGPVRITVVGTRFSVRNTRGIDGATSVRVAVEEGRVRVRRQQSLAAELVASLSGEAKLVELAAGQQLAAGPSGLPGPVSAVAPGGIAPWRENRVSFDDTPLAQALAELARYGDTRLAVRDPAVAALRLTGTFDPRRIEGFRRILPQVLPVHLRERDGVSEIVSRR